MGPSGLAPERIARQSVVSVYTNPSHEGSQPLLHQKGEELQEFGTVRLFPIALAWEAQKGCADEMLRWEGLRSATSLALRRRNYDRAISVTTGTRRHPCRTRCRVRSMLGLTREVFGRVDELADLNGIVAGHSSSISGRKMSAAEQAVSPIHPSANPWTQFSPDNAPNQRTFTSRKGLP